MEREHTIKAFVVFMKAAKSVQERIKHDIANYDLSPTEFAVLEILYHKGKQTVQQICNRILLASGSMTYVIDKLEKKDLLKRNFCKEDRRVIHLTITVDGRKLMDEIFPQHEIVIQELFGDLLIEEKKLLISILKKVGQKADFKS
jgi:MarR family 2-MHQ and catechol resistance regulon transcriptional repressor